MRRAAPRHADTITKRAIARDALFYARKKVTEPLALDIVASQFPATSLINFTPFLLLFVSPFSLLSACVVYIYIYMYICTFLVRCVVHGQIVQWSNS